MLTVALLLSCLLGIAGCTGSGAHASEPDRASTPSGSSGDTSTPGRRPAQPDPGDSGAADRSLGAAANGQTVNVTVGAHVTVEVPTTNWTFLPSRNPHVLRQSPEVVRNGPVTCRSLGDCGSVTLTVRAIATGRATVRASREKCGELIRCTGAHGRFAVTVLVRP